MVKIVQIAEKGGKILRDKAKKVPTAGICTPKIQAILEKMRKGIDAREDAVAIAAPQIGYSLRIFIVSRKVFIVENEDKDAKDLVCINPVITKISRKKTESEEGCLSVNTWYGTTKRAEKISIKAYDENGNVFERGTGGLLAQIFQHEIDHLNGILFVDNAKDLFKLELTEKTKEKISNEKN